MSTDSGPTDVDRNLMNTDANAGLQALLKPAGESSDQARGEKRKREEEEEEEEKINDEVRLWEDGFKVYFAFPEDSHCNCNSMKL